MGYGKRALQQLEAYCRGEITSLFEGAAAKKDAEPKHPRLAMLEPRKNLPALLNKLSELPPPKLPPPRAVASTQARHPPPAHSCARVDGGSYALIKPK